MEELYKIAEKKCETVHKLNKDIRHDFNFI